MAVGSDGKKKIAALVRLAGTGASDMLEQLGLDVPDITEVQGVDQATEDEVMEEIFAMMMEGGEVPPGFGAATANAAAPTLASASTEQSVTDAEAGSKAEDSKQSDDAEEENDPFGQVSARRFAQFLSEEHPQTVALLLASVKSERAGDVLGFLDEGIKVDALTRLARLECVPSGALTRAIAALSNKMSALPVEVIERSSGVRLAAGVLKCLGRESATEILGAMADVEPELSEEIEQNIYTFEDLAILTPADARVLVPRLDRKTLATALSASPEDIFDLIMGCLSSGMRATLEEEMEFGGIRKASEIADAQTEIVQAALQADADGEIQFIKGGR